MYQDNALRALHSVSDHSTVSTMVVCALITLLVLVLWVSGAAFLLYNTSFGMEGGWLEMALDWLLGAGVLISAWILFPVLLPAIASMFLDGFLERVASEEYRLTLRKVPIIEELPKSILFVVQALLINLLLLPFYFIPLVGQVLYFVVNGYLLAREFWVMICHRLMIEPKSLKSRRSTLIVSGVILLFFANLPLFNLLVPLIAAAYMLHLGKYALDNQLAVAKQGKTTPITQKM